MPGEDRIQWCNEPVWVEGEVLRPSIAVGVSSSQRLRLAIQYGDNLASDEYDTVGFFHSGQQTSTDCRTLSG